MLYDDDSGAAYHLPEQPRKMIGVIVVVCSAFGLTISQAKIEIICLRTKKMSEETTISCVEAASQMYN